MLSLKSHNTCVYTVVKKTAAFASKLQDLRADKPPNMEIFTSNGTPNSSSCSRSAIGMDDRSICGSRKRKVALNEKPNYDFHNFVYDDEVDHVDANIMMTVPVESSYSVPKRVRLAHLSEEEKMLRRKVMNRMAAQQARDRKKVQMDYLEEAVLKLEGEKKHLICENQLLHQKLLDMEDKYTKLLSRRVAAAKPTDNRRGELASARKSSTLAFGSAASYPLQQGMSSVVEFLMLAQLLVMISGWSSSTTSRKIRSISFIKLDSPTWMMVMSSCKRMTSPSAFPLSKKLWGYQRHLEHNWWITQSQLQLLRHHQMIS